MTTDENSAELRSHPVLVAVYAALAAGTIPFGLISSIFLLVTVAPFLEYLVRGHGVMGLVGAAFAGSAAVFGAYRCYRAARSGFRVLRGKELVKPALIDLAVVLVVVLPAMLLIVGAVISSSGNLSATFKEWGIEAAPK